MAATQSVAKPVSSYWLWLGENREKIVKMLGTAKGSEVAKKGGEMWKALSASAKKPFDDLAKEKKDAYEKFIATPEGAKALEEKKSAKADEKSEKTQKAESIAGRKAEQEEKRNERACKAAVKGVEKDDALKKPACAYWTWLQDNREKIIKLLPLGANKITGVAKKGGEMWKAATASEKAPYEKNAKEQKEKYDAYRASAEGQKAMQAFKDATSEAKAQFAPKEPQLSPAEIREQENDKKRKAADEVSPQTDAAAKKDDKKRKAADEVPPQTDAGAKKARGRPPKVQTATLGA